MSIFIETSIFSKYRADYFTDDEFLLLQKLLLKKPDSGNIIKHSGGIRKIRYLDIKRNKGKRSGLRIIYYYYPKLAHFWLLTLYDKDTQDNLSHSEIKILKTMIETIKRNKRV